MSEIAVVTVRAAVVTDRVALWERHPAHPGGEAFIAGDGVAVAVAATPTVVALLAAGVLARADVQTPDATPEPEPAPDAVPAPPRRRKPQP